MPIRKGGVKFAIVVVDYFTKWAEAEPFATITEQKTTNFLWKSVICRFGIPHSSVTDNGKQFDNARLLDFCEELGIKKHFSSPNHPHANGQVEAINKIIKRILKAKLDLFKGGWAEDSPVCYGLIVLLQGQAHEKPQINIPSLRIADYDEERNYIALRTELNLTEKKRNNAKLKNVVYKQRNVKYYNKKVRKREFEIGSLVLRKVFLLTREIDSGCLGPNWEGPYLITKVLLKGAYELEDLGVDPYPILGMSNTLSSTISERKKPPSRSKVVCAVTLSGKLLLRNLIKSCSICRPI
ncbi:uncharacterized protein K02A2.6-like [Olea europaea var. sylvestris]|uniref:uncharacterized protein K02A2.6-like n=1 Tax=Olea europaea var. sylvestris TaxID=158386 RepID=UPI000C1D38BD|nr:uncharacterized protein K02A2.6-like [Olea europaea var. sylvestris]